MKPAGERKVMTHAEWKAEGQRRFGPNVTAWRFVCPVCKHEQSVADCEVVGVPTNAIGFSCIGRWLPREQTRDAFGSGGTVKAPCNYAGGGLFRLNPVDVVMPDGKTLQVFAFAEVPAEPPQTISIEVVE